MGFTLTDGALRMLVLLHFYQLGYTPFTLATLFLLYETAGIFANLGGGWLALALRHPAHARGRHGAADRGPPDAVRAFPRLGRCRLRRLGRGRPGHRGRCQGPDQDGVQVCNQGHLPAGLRPALQVGGLVHRLEERHEGHRLLLRRSPTAVPRLPLGALADGSDAGHPARWRHRRPASELGKAKGSKSFRELFAKTRAINLLAAARIFMFGSRDVWFVVGLPVFLYASGWRYIEVAGFLAAWTIGYGVVQAIAPSVVSRSADGLSRELAAARLWGALLTAVPVAIALLLPTGLWRPDLLVVVGLCVFGFAFAVISSLHSYLILAYAGSEKAAEDVGFYYAANAAGRLLGIVLSGVLTQAGGLLACLWGAGAMLATCLAITWLLPVDATIVTPAGARPAIR